MQSRTRFVGFIAFAMLVVFCLANVAQAGDRDHIGGFFMRLSGGVGGASTKLDDENDEYKLSDPSGDFNFAFGAMVAPNLALHGTVFGWSITDPDLEVNKVERHADGDLTMGALGVGVTYYVMPANLYLSGSIGVASLTLDARQFEVESDEGVALDLTIGKEWWVGRKWGLGVAGSLGVHSISDGNNDDKWSGASVGIRFSATMN